MSNTEKVKFLIFMDKQFGYTENNWQQLKGNQQLPARIMTIGKDDKGYFYHICNNHFNDAAVLLKNMGVTHWQIAK